ncbi:MAG: ABC-type transport auxiliary lipoprotein family protein [Azospirillaceae bacterium]|nr:ABC-type transport auxiliary lipoprotein family protein [Azospirillaceae bacterium]
MIEGSREGAGGTAPGILGDGALSRRLLLTSLAALTAVAGCTAFSPDQSRLFNLRAARQFSPDLPQADWQLVVDLPVSAAGLDTSRIALSTDPTSVDYFAGVAWIERVPLLVQGLMVESFENSGRIVAVGRDSADLRADFVLTTDLRDFQAEYSAGRGAPPQAHVRWTAKLVAMPRRSIEASRTFEARIPASGSGIEAVVEAFDAALSRVMSDIVAWALIQGSRAFVAGGGRPPLPPRVNG